VRASSCRASPTHYFVLTQATHVLITPQKNESASSALRQATLSPGAVNTPVLLLPWHVLIGSDGEIHIVKLLSWTHVVCEILHVCNSVLHHQPKLSLATAAPRIKRQR
jgi:hypothetical protein